VVVEAVARSLVVQQALAAVGQEVVELARQAQRIQAAVEVEAVVGHQMVLLAVAV
jgi:hypothetical protein